LQVLENIDDLFDREELSAAPDAGWPDCFNSGVFVFCPSLDTYRTLVHFAVTHGSFDGMFTVQPPLLLLLLLGRVCFSVATLFHSKNQLDLPHLT